MLESGAFCLSSAFSFARATWRTHFLGARGLFGCLLAFSLSDRKYSAVCKSEAPPYHCVEGSWFTT